MGSSLARQFPVQNSLTSDKAIKIDNLAQFLQKSQSLETRHHDGYGQLHTIKYKNEILYVGQSKTALPPPKQALHWLIQPSKVLVVPYYTKLENIEISKLKKQNSTESQTSVLMFIKEVCEFLKDKEIGMSRNKIAFSQKWTIMGQKNSTSSLWNYHYILKRKRNKDVEKAQGIYLSPELMKSLSKQKLYPKVNINKSDTFILGIMLLQAISNSQLHKQVFNYQTCQIRPKPMIKVLNEIKAIFGRFIYKILIRMLQIKPQQRISFTEIIYEIQNYQICSEQKQNTIDLTKTNETLDFHLMKTPPPSKIQNSSDSIRKREIGRSPGAIRKNFQSSSKTQYGIIVKSPLKNRNRSIFNKITRS